MSVLAHVVVALLLVELLVGFRQRHQPRTGCGGLPRHTAPVCGCAGVPGPIRPIPGVVLGGATDDLALYHLRPGLSDGQGRQGCRYRIGNAACGATLGAGHVRHPREDLFERLGPNLKVDLCRSFQACPVESIADSRQAHRLRIGTLCNLQQLARHSVGCVIPSGAATLDSEDIEVLIEHVRHHAYGVSAGSKLLILANRAESEVIQGFRVGQTNNNTKVAKFDFVPSALAPAFLSAEHVIGTTAPDNFNGLPCAGSYGPALLIESSYIPAGYVAVVASGGPNSEKNAIGVREHEDPAYRGLRHIPGPGPYPLTESYFQRSFGVGVRHRGAAACMQVTTNGSYAAPTALIEV